MNQYYSNRLSAERLKMCYELAPPRTKQYLHEEIAHVQRNISATDSVLELGCGYGRVLEQIVDWCGSLTGIDLSFESLKMAKESASIQEVELIQMNAGLLAFADASFDVTVCIQNGLSAIKLDPKHLIEESVRVTRSGGLCMFSSYSESFWKDRVEWFRIQSENGLIGEIDWDRTRDGTIVCKDGFSATTLSPAKLARLVEDIEAEFRISEVDCSSLFLEIRPIE